MSLERAILLYRDDIEMNFVFKLPENAQFVEDVVKEAETTLHKLRIDRCNRNEMSVLVEFKDEAVWFIRFFLSIREDIIL